MMSLKIAVVWVALVFPSWFLPKVCPTESVGSRQIKSNRNKERIRSIWLPFHVREPGCTNIAALTQLLLTSNIPKKTTLFKSRYYEFGLTTNRSLHCGSSTPAKFFQNQIPCSAEYISIYYITSERMRHLDPKKGGRELLFSPPLKKKTVPDKGEDWIGLHLFPGSRLFLKSFENLLTQILVWKVVSPHGIKLKQISCQRDFERGSASSFRFAVGISNPS